MVTGLDGEYLTDLSCLIYLFHHKVVNFPASVLVGGAESADLNIDVERGAELNIVHAVAERSVADIAVALAEGAVCRITVVVTSSSDVHVVASLMEPNARFELDGAFVLTGEE